MLDISAGNLKPYRLVERPPFGRIALVLQGGGALGSYQSGVYQALAEANLHPDWVAGISIGSVNAALIAGNPPEKRVEKLREFWETISASPSDLNPFLYIHPGEITGFSLLRKIAYQAHAFFTLLLGAPHFYSPRFPPPLYPLPYSADVLSFYDVAPLNNTLERLVDFDRINSGAMRLSVGATNVRTGDLHYFDTATQRVGPAHILASCSLPPGFPATKIDGEYYWDGGVVSNTPLQWVLESAPCQDTLAFQIDLWSAAGEAPSNFVQVAEREKEIRYSSRTRVLTDHIKNARKLRIAAAELVKRLPDDLRNCPEAKLLEEHAEERVCNIVHLIYRSKAFEGIAKDFELDRPTMSEHWQAGFDDGVASLRHPEVLQLPNKLEGIRTFDLSAKNHHSQLL